MKKLRGIFPYVPPSSAATGYRGTECTSQRVGENRRCQQTCLNRRRVCRFAGSIGFYHHCEVHSVLPAPPKCPPLPLVQPTTVDQHRTLSADPCNTYLNEGEGVDNLARWYYSPLDGGCHEFLYRGRKGNENNFLSKSACEDRCQPGTIIIFLKNVEKMVVFRCEPVLRK
jgi:hypothetical protein